jgi:hypothetical protein
MGMTLAADEGADYDVGSDQQRAFQRRLLSRANVTGAVAIVGMSSTGRTLAETHLRAQHGYRQVEAHEPGGEPWHSFGEDDADEIYDPEHRYVQCVQGEYMPDFSDPWWNRYSAIIIIVRGGKCPPNINPLHERAEILINDSTTADLHHCIDRLVHLQVIQGDVRRYSHEAEGRWQEQQRGRGSA